MDEDMKFIIAIFSIIIVVVDVIRFRHRLLLLLLHILLQLRDGAQSRVDLLQIVAPDAESVVQLLPLGFAEGAHLRRRDGDSLVHLIHFASNHFRLDHFDDEIFHILRGELEMKLNFGERNDLGIADGHGHERQNPHFVDVVFVTQAQRRNKVRIGTVELQVVLKSSADENDEQIVDELSFEELDGFEEEEVIEKERLLVADAGHDAPMGVVTGLRSVLVRIGPQ